MIRRAWNFLRWLFADKGHRCIANDPACTKDSQCDECWESWLW